MNCKTTAAAARPMPRRYERMAILPWTLTMISRRSARKVQITSSIAVGKRDRAAKSANEEAANRGGLATKQQRRSIYLEGPSADQLALSQVGCTGTPAS